MSSRLPSFAKRLARAVVVGGAATAAGCLATARAAQPSHIIDPRDIGFYIDHTILAPAATPTQVEAVAREAVAHGFASVCVNGAMVRIARETIDSLGGGTTICAVVGFPLGASASSVKAFEAETAIADGAGEIDMVIPIGILKAAACGADGGQALSYVVRDVSAVVGVCRPRGVLVKVILETSLLTDAERDLGVRLAALAGADFVKTSTGFAGGGATIRDVRAMAEMARTVGAY